MANADYSSAPDHPIIDKPFQYQIIEMAYHVDLRNFLDSYIDLTLLRDADVRHLRFWGPQGLKIEEGFPNSTDGMAILDISEWQWQDLNVAVTDFEASSGSIIFWARDVIDLDAL